MTARWPLAVTVGLVFLFLLAPIAVVVFAAFDDGRFFRFPPRSYSLRWFEAALESAEYRSALRNSVIIACASTAGSVVLGASAGFALVRGRMRGSLLVQALLLAPLTLPLVVWAVALLQVFSRLGMSGTLFGLILAHVVITLPFTVRIMMATFASIDPALDAAARSLGARPLTAFARTTLPLARSGLFASAALSFLVSFNDVIVSTFIAGAGWITFPVRMYAQLRGQGIDPITMAIGAMIIAGILIALALAEAFFKISRRL